MTITDHTTQYCFYQCQRVKIRRHFSCGWPSVLAEAVVNLKVMFSFLLMILNCYFLHLSKNNQKSTPSQLEGVFQNLPQLLLLWSRLWDQRSGYHLLRIQTTLKAQSTKMIMVTGKEPQSSSRGSLYKIQSVIS